MNKKSPANLDESVRKLWEEYVLTRNERIRGILEGAYLPLVDHVARRLVQRLPDCVDVHDLRQEGFIGLRRAVERFSPERAVKFTTFAQRAIWGAMMDSLRRDDVGSRTARRRCNKVQEARNELANEYGRPPTYTEMAAALKMAEKDVMETQRWINATSITSMSPADEQKQMQVADRRVVDPGRRVEWEELREVFLRGFGRVERLILELYYMEELTMQEIGRALGISESRVSQIHDLVMKRLRAELEWKRKAYE